MKTTYIKPNSEVIEMGIGQMLCDSGLKVYGEYENNNVTDLSKGHNNDNWNEEDNDY